jgi:hypothetical protein
MLERGEVHSDPRAPSRLDRVASTEAAGRLRPKRRWKSRSHRQASPPGSVGRSDEEWRVARTLDELIELRRALLYKIPEPDDRSTL